MSVVLHTLTTIERRRVNNMWFWISLIVVIGFISFLIKMTARTIWLIKEQLNVWKLERGTNEK